MFLHRLCSTLIFTPLLVLVLVYSKSVTEWVIPLLLSVFGLLGVLEYLKMTSFKGFLSYPFFSAFIAGLYPWFLYFSLKNNCHSGDIESFFLFLIVLLSFILFFQKTGELGSNSRVIESLSVILQSFVYIPWCLGFFLKILFLPAVDGRLLIIFLVLVCKSTDIFGYVFGKTMGRHKLSPVISPNKTIEGAIGGIVCSLLIAHICYFIFLDQMMSFPKLWIYGITLPLISIVGDLTESLLKRDAAFKDSGGIVPGLGGVLDMLDSILFAVPFVYFIETMPCCSSL